MELDKQNDAEKIYRNILVIALRKIGDTIIATAGINLLRRAYPDARLTVLVRPYVQQIVENHLLIDEVMLYNYSHKAKWREIWAISQKLREKRFDVCIVLDNKPRAALLAYLAGIPKRVGFEKITLRNLYLKALYTDIIPIDYDSMQVQQAKNHEIFINRFTGLQEKTCMVMPNVCEVSRQKVDSLLAALKPAGRKKIALCLRSGCLTKDWPLEYFRQTVEKLAKQYQAVFFIIGSTNDKAAAEAFINQTDADIVSFCGQTTLPELGYLLQQADLFLSVDTGSAHIGGAVGTPMVVMFGATSPKRWGPYTEQAICLVPDIACHPCDGTKTKCSEPRCLAAINPEQVYEACCKMLEGGIKNS